MEDYVKNAGPEGDRTPKHKDGKSYGKTNRRLLGGILAHVKRREDGRGFIPLEYTLSKLGETLKGAGHIRTSREYVLMAGADPFKTTPGTPEDRAPRLGLRLRRHGFFP